MKQKFLFTLSILFSCIPAFSMPPHPAVIDAYEREGRLSELSARMALMQSRTVSTRSASLHSSALSKGTVYVPVVLAAFGTPYTAADPVPVPSTPRKGTPLPPVFFLFAAGFAAVLATMMFPPLRRRTAFSAPVLAAALALSCGGSSGSVSPPYFPTPVSYFNTILNGSGAEGEVSARQYFKDMSNGNLTIQFDFFGPVKVSKA